MLLVTLHGSPVRVRVRIPEHPWILANSATSPTALSRPSCTGALMRVARLQPAPYTEYWSRLPARHLPILSPPVNAVLAPLLLSNPLHSPGGTMLEMLGRLSNQFSAQHTGCRTSPTSPIHRVLVQVACVAPAHPEPLSLRDLGSSRPVQLPACTLRDNSREAGSLVQPVLYTAYWSRVPSWPPAHPESISLRDCGSSLPFQLPAPHLEGWC